MISSCGMVKAIAPKTWTLQMKEVLYLYCDSTPQVPSTYIVSSFIISQKHRSSRNNSKMMFCNRLCSSIPDMNSYFNLQFCTWLFGKIIIDIAIQLCNIEPSTFQQASYFLLPPIIVFFLPSWDVMIALRCVKTRSNVSYQTYIIPYSNFIVNNPRREGVQTLFEPQILIKDLIYKQNCIESEELEKKKK